MVRASGGKLLQRYFSGFQRQVESVGHPIGEGPEGREVQSGFTHPGQRIVRGRVLDPGLQGTQEIVKIRCPLRLGSSISAAWASAS